jgi:hypothetical protein
MTDINQWMINHHYAKNVFEANHIFQGLELYRESRFWLRVKRIVIYRRWRTSQVYGKNTKLCFDKAVRGERPPKELFEKESA